jgi:hypothetical protein
MRPGSLYVDLLDAALSERDLSDDAQSSGEALAQLDWYRHEVIWNQRSPSDRDWTAPALADQMAYDIALIRHARSLGVDCDPDRFGSPEDERKRIERLLASRGIPLGYLAYRRVARAASALSGC